MNRKIWSILVAVIMLASLLAIAGCAGDDGAVGPAGLRGLQGEQGAQGLQGGQGSQGTTGPQGEQGIAGAAGEQGSTGEQGAQGTAGADGATGPAGSQGPRGGGSRGSTGATGATGAIGVTGPRGPAGVFPAFSVELQVKTTNQASITYDTTIVASGSRSLHLTTTGTPGTGDEARIVLTPLQPMTLGEVLTVSWSEYLVSGYPPHVDIRLDTVGDGVVDEALVIEYAHNTMAHYGEAPMPYGALTGAWYVTFADDGNGPVVIDGTAHAWQATGAAGPAGGAFGDGGYYGDTLANWKAGLTGNGGTYIDANSLVLAIEIEVDNWVVQSDAYVDNITVNGVAIPD